MDKFFKLSQSKKFVATLALAVFAFVFALTGITLLNVNAEPLSSAVVNEDGTLADITPPTNGGYYGIAHYEFNDADNLGKDSLGNFDLAVGSGVTVDETNGGASLGGIMYAQKINDQNTDFSDLMAGSWSISTRIYMQTGEKTAHYLFATGSYSNAFMLCWRYSGFQVARAIDTYSYVGTNSGSAKTSGNLFDATPSWYRLNIIFNDSDNSLKFLATKDNDDSFEFLATTSLVNENYFGGHSYSFTIGGQSSFGSSIKQKLAMSTFTPSMSDLRIYSGVIDQDEIDAIAAYDAANADSEVADNPTTLGMAKSLVANSSEVVGAALRLSGNTGLRFLATLKESVVNEYVTTYGEENVEFGIKLIRNHNDVKEYLYVPATNKELNNGTYSFNAVITDLTEDYYATEFTAQVYISYTVGEKITYVDADLPLSELTRSVSQVAALAIADTYTVDVDGTLEDKPEKYAYEIETGVYSAYSTTQLEKLNALLAE